MKKIILFCCLMLITLSIFSKQKNDQNNKSNYLRKSYGIPVNFTEKEDEMTGQKKITSSGIILYYARIGWDNTGMWWIIRTENNKNEAVLIIRSRLSNWSFFNKVFIKVNDELLSFSEEKKNLSNDQDVITDGVSEFVACYMDIPTMKKIISSETFKISIRGKEGQQDYTIFKEVDWNKLLDLE